jgi:hypothetical protein
MGLHDCICYKGVRLTAEYLLRYVPTFDAINWLCV